MMHLPKVTPAELLELPISELTLEDLENLQGAVVRPDMAHSRTAKDWGQFLGKSATNLGVAAKMY
jgi:hypothetical protein